MVWLAVEQRYDSRSLCAIMVVQNLLDVLASWDVGDVDDVGRINHGVCRRNESHDDAVAMLRV